MCGTEQGCSKIPLHVSVLYYVMSLLDFLFILLHSSLQLVRYVQTFRLNWDKTHRRKNSSNKTV